MHNVYFLDKEIAEHFHQISALSIWFDPMPSGHGNLCNKILKDEEQPANIR